MCVRKYRKLYYEVSTMTAGPEYLTTDTPLFPLILTRHLPQNLCFRALVLVHRNIRVCRCKTSLGGIYVNG